MFHEQEMKDGAMVCLLDMQCAKEYGYQPGDSLIIHEKQCKIIGIMDSSIYSGIVIPYRTMKKLYQMMEKYSLQEHFSLGTVKQKM